MCFRTRKTTIEEIIAENAVGMTDHQKAQYWYELSMSIFNLLGKVDVPTYEITAQQWIDAALAQYPTLTDIKIPDSLFVIPSLAGLQEILSRDWTEIVPYVAETSDCDDFGSRLYDHLCTYYRITGVLPVWGDTDQGTHGFNIAVLFSIARDGVFLQDSLEFYARLVEPQTDSIFIDSGPLGQYIPRKTVVELGIKPKALREEFNGQKESGAGRQD